MSILTENWHLWYFGGVDSKSRLRFLKFRPKNPFLGKFGPKNSKLSVLSENWYTKYLKDANSKSRLRFLKFQPQNSKLSILSEIGAHSISRMLIPNPYLDFWNLDPKIQFWANLGSKTQSCPYCLKIGTHGILRMLILIPTLSFMNFKS